jgi:uncharacterized protein (DUF488 family)
MSMRAYSLGYEGLNLDQYIEVLKAHGITLIIDVRETAWSYKPGFSKKPLEERLSSENISYIHLKSAGNPSRNRKLGLPQNEVIELYRRHLNTNTSCLDEIYKLMKSVGDSGGVCLLCFEAQPHDCHRTVILNKLAEDRGGLITCHLSGQSKSEQAITTKRIPQPYDRKRLRKHVDVAQNKRRAVVV